MEKDDAMTKEIHCPQCGSKSLYRDGIRYLEEGSAVQRWLCRTCGYRFSDPNHKKNCNRSDMSQHVQRIQSLNLKTPDALTYTCRVSARRQSEAKNLVEVEPRSENWAAGATTKASRVKGKIIEYAWWLKKKGLSEITIETRMRKLNRLVKLGCDPMDPESVKETLAKQEWKSSTKASLTSICTNFLHCFGLSWEPPIYKPVYEIPFIPTESEIDQLIAGSGKKMAALLQLLKETAIRIGEACRTRWIDLDPKQKTIRIRAEKNSNPRIFHISDKLLNMLNILPKKDEHIFTANVRSLQSYCLQLRKRLAKRLSNSRLKEIHFHTLRHWKATQLYHQTKDILYVKEFLGHKKLDSTLRYINIEKALYYDDKPEDFHVKIAEKPEEIRGLLEVGFEYVCEKDGLVFFRKRK